MKNNWFYTDPKDEKLFVTHEKAKLGYVLNFGNPLAYVFLLILLLIIILITRLL